MTLSHLWNMGTGGWSIYSVEISSNCFCHCSRISKFFTRSMSKLSLACVILCCRDLRSCWTLTMVIVILVEFFVQVISIIAYDARSSCYGECTITVSVSALFLRLQLLLFRFWCDLCYVAPPLGLLMSYHPVSFFVGVEWLWYALYTTSVS